ncbi:hypothetical protein C5Y96_22840 [Blastopirellula marina]|uniref:Alpha-galactosidase n=1 Tax=Blastopirellula marina TaxID=124 RepID=A0A2S8F0G8_9BACT|nr:MULTISPECIES: hypothetical protein [Pirellulaceae]PQO25661.1 hypothetical protein C5Y96_22840 [Blastopirellula marina]RCS43344.1 hypothetical protein DTL36_22890 [Bremerella cremea]
MFSSRPSLIITCLLAMLLFDAAILSANDTAQIDNSLVTRELSWESGHLVTKGVVNRLTSRQAAVSDGDEFALTIRLPDSSQDLRLSSSDFQVQSTTLSEDHLTLEVQLTGQTAPVDVVVRYVTKRNQPWLRKQLHITARKSLQLRKIEIEHLASADVYAPYRSDQMTSQGPAAWRPPLGQPLYTETSGMWWGVEFPAARNHVDDGNLVCGYLTQVDLSAGEMYASHMAAMGVADDPSFVKDAFLDYIDQTRARPLRLQTQYNSWFDYSRDVDADKFAASVRKVNKELVVDRNVPPLRVYAIDAGWQDITTDWTKVGVWPVNDKFAPGFQLSLEEVHRAKSSLGLWVSPGCLFGSQQAIPKMREAGWRALDPWMSMTGEHYMNALEDRLVELASHGVSYFKLDGVFGHLRTRNFDIEGFQGSEKMLNDAKYDEAKERYLSLGSERLIKIFDHMGEVNPDVYIVISNGAYLSPWWLQHVDAVWLINVGDHARGDGRNAQLAYRDGAYYQMASENADNTQFPLNSIFNHEPKKVSSDEEPEDFRRYLLMSLSRGTGFVELYLHTFSLSESDWDVLGEGMHWVHRMFPTFQRARMIGGNPMQGEVYGYTGWTDDLGYVSLHNPSDETQEFEITLDRNLGLPKLAVSQRRTYNVSSAIEEDQALMPKQATAGERCTIKLPPGAIRIVEFTAEQRTTQ